MIIPQVQNIDHLQTLNIYITNELVTRKNYTIFSIFCFTFFVTMGIIFDQPVTSYMTYAQYYSKKTEKRLNLLNSDISTQTFQLVGPNPNKKMGVSLEL